jgi:hypothetical protein
MIQVMTSEIPGSKYSVHRPSQLGMSVDAGPIGQASSLQPNDKAGSNDSDISETVNQ